MREQPTSSVVGTTAQSLGGTGHRPLLWASLDGSFLSVEIVVLLSDSGYARPFLRHQFTYPIQLEMAPWALRAQVSTRAGWGGSQSACFRSARS